MKINSTSHALDLSYYLDLGSNIQTQYETILDKDNKKVAHEMKGFKIKKLPVNFTTHESISNNEDIKVRVSTLL